MRRALANLSAGTTILVLGAAAGPAAGADSTRASGGLAAPQTGMSHDPSVTGGTAYERRRKRRRPARRRRPSAPLLASFAVKRPRLFLYGHPVQVAFRIRSRVKLVDVRISMVARGSRRPASTIRLGARRSGVEHHVSLTGRESGTLPEGAYRVRISAKDARGRRLRRGAGVSSAGELAFLHHRFPLGGPFTDGGPDARFGAGRKGHTHQGHDLAAREGTPVLAPRGGVVKAVEYQAGGAGHYVVLDGTDEQRDYVFMHLRTGSVRVRAGQTVRTSQQIGQVGNTGRSFGAHLHFEVWTGGGWFSGGKAVDPLPLLKAWETFG